MCKGVKELETKLIAVIEEKINEKLNVKLNVKLNISQ